MKSLFFSFVSAPRLLKQGFLIILDFLLFPILIWFCYALRAFDLGAAVVPNVAFGSLWVSLLATVSLLGCGVYRFIVRNFNEAFIIKLAVSTALTVVSLYAMAYATPAVIPTSIPLMFGFMMFAWVWFSRSIIRFTVKAHLQADKPRRRIVIYGAGLAGQQIAATLMRSDEHLPVFFIDDDVALSKNILGGLRVYPPEQAMPLLDKLGIDEVLIALPSVERQRRNEIIHTLEPARKKITELPGLTQLVDGKINISDIREINIVDLLGRDPVPPIEGLLAQNIRQKTVMVTGAGGSIGSELCRQILSQQPEKLILFEVNEFGLYSIEKELHALAEQSGVELIPIVGTIQSQADLQRVMQTFSVQTIYHAAAYKHVPLVEYNVASGVRNNVLGTWYCAQAAIAARVETFVLISTDKAVRPTNTMGASKRMAELVLQALAQENHATRFTMVRFGNVLGSSGSVVPLFEAQIMQGGPITLTHQDITRYFMTIPEAAQLVIQAGAMGKNGDVFVLDMGEPVKIYDLAVRMIHLKGKKLKTPEDEDGIEIRLSGLRPGEKLYEELLIGDTVEKTAHQKIMTAMEVMLPWSELHPLLLRLQTACDDYNIAEIREILLNAPTAFQPVDDICDVVWNAKQ